MNNDKINKLMDYLQAHPGEETARRYNRISNMLWKDFNISSSGMSLLCLYIVNEYNKTYKEDNKDG